ncbi:MAG: arginase family protein [Desulfobacterales bacterium]|nr:arginase family protein [Desulfobacterales bacterium]
MADQVSTQGAFRDLRTDSYDKADVIIMGIPFDGGASLGKGTCEGPAMIRNLSVSLPAITENGYPIKDFSIKDGGDFDLNIHIEKYFEKIQNGARKIFEDGKFGMFIGGDHSVTIPLQRAFFDNYGKNLKIGVIHFDTHPDIMDEYLSSKLAHACPNRRNIEHENFDKSGLTLMLHKILTFFSVYHAAFCNTSRK